jgi:predicted nucleic acid-binding protein
MPRSTIFLPDGWLRSDSIEQGPVLFCRVTQMGLLRLLTNPTVMGIDVLPGRAACRTYESIPKDDRIEYRDEPIMLEQEWRALTDNTKLITKLWTDAYIAAFARAGGMRAVTFDAAMAAKAPGALLLRQDARILKDDSTHRRRQALRPEDPV